MRSGKLFVAMSALLLSSAFWVSSGRTASSPVMDRDAATIYRNSCASCHGSDGKAKTFKAKFNGAKDLTKPEWQEKVSDAHIFNVISNGKAKMPSFGKKFSLSEIEALVAFVRRLRR
jgi:mono/diheme cytochrome c family protein